MADEPITHRSAKKQLPQLFEVLETTNKNGEKCVWTGNVPGPQNSRELSLSWSLDWSELRKTSVDTLSGYITVTSPHGFFPPRTVKVDLTANPGVITTSIEDESTAFKNVTTFEWPKKTPYDEMFLPSELNDTILVIDEKRLHVNRAFLSYHSEFFRALFSSKFKEGQMDEIPIKDVSYADFGLLMSTIYPETVYPDDITAEKLLELADRFLIPSVIKHVEVHLLRDTCIDSDKLLWMADKYGMKKLFKKCMLELNTVENVKKLYKSPEYEKLSNEAKVEILGILMKII